jgi:hypothetical protein
LTIAKNIFFMFASFTRKSIAICITYSARLSLTGPRCLWWGGYGPSAEAIVVPGISEKAHARRRKSLPGEAAELVPGLFRMRVQAIS